MNRASVPTPIKAKSSPFGPKSGYSPNDLIPQGLTSRAQSFSGKKFDVSVPNTADWGTDLTKFDPEQIWRS